MWWRDGKITDAEYSWIEPGMLRCTHCRYYDENIPSSFRKKGAVLIPSPYKKVKNVNPILALIMISILLLFIVALLVLSVLWK